MREPESRIIVFVNLFINYALIATLKEFNQKASGIGHENRIITMETPKFCKCIQCRKMGGQQRMFGIE